MDYQPATPPVAKNHSRYRSNQKRELLWMANADLDIEQSKAGR